MVTKMAWATPLSAAMSMYTSLFLVLAAIAMAQTATPVNDTLSSQVADLVLLYSSSNMAVVYPLKPDVGLGGSLTVINAVQITGTLRAITAMNLNSVSSDQVALISCDSNANTSNIDSSAVINTVASKIPKVQAIILYSATQPHCSISGTWGNTVDPYTSIFTLVNTADASMLTAFLSTATNTPSGTIRNLNRSTGNPSNQTSTSTTQSGPTTAVAMSILYSITGIITILFLAIIATGAVRAHRHPERYGPRGGFPGRPRQSRAKGLARAMLETLPIIKFGDPEPTKPGSRDVELEDGTHSPPGLTETGHDVSTTKPTAPETDAASSTAHESGMGPATQATSVHSHEEAAKGGSLGCSICTEDFTKGEDVRVLPCNHKYHPACIDPWLLNVSGTCPLCRVDLRPVQSNTSTTAGNDGELPPPLSNDGAGPRPSAAEAAELANVRNAEPNERLAALRALHESGRARATEQAENEGEEGSHRTSLATRLRETFHIRTRSGVAVEREASGALSGSGDATSAIETAANAPSARL